MRRIDLRKVQAARLNMIRDINRQIVLNYVREREPISRAEIARQTQLQRSTISVIVDGLTEEGLIEDVGEGASIGGRRPTLLRLRTAGAMALGVAITPTQTIIASSDLAGRIVGQRKFQTDPDPDQTLNQVIALVREFSSTNNGSIESVGVSIPGLVDPSTGHALFVPHFQWRDLPVTERICSGTGLPVTIDNDANAVALAELWFGRPEVIEGRDFILVLVGEGIGTGIVLDGQVYRGERGAAGEFGHMIVGFGAPVPCSCGNYDCWEALSSERATLARYSNLTRSEGSSCTGFEELVDLALAGEPNARAALVETAHYLGIGISNLVVGFSPEAVVVVGEITRAWSLIEEALTETMERSVRRGLSSARILRSTLDSQPTLMGALSLVLAGKFAAAFAA